MKQIAYLASQVTLPGSPNRRSDAYEHDLMMDRLTPSFEALDMAITAVSWDDPDADWQAFDAAIIGTTWDYWDHHETFLKTLERIEENIPVFNPPALVRWNSHKSYLKDIEARGAKLIPTLWLDEATPERATAAFDTLGSDDLVFKRQVGAGADGQHRLRRGDSIPAMPLPMMAQPFLSTIQSEGELSFIYIDGAFSHALLKRAASGDYRIQSTYGGIEEAVSPTPSDLAVAGAMMSTLDTPPLYARVDMVRGDNGGLLLMELEMIEPYLYPEQGPELGERMAKAIESRLAG
jgi:hypothetical protein